MIPNGVDPAPFDRAEAVDRASLGVPADAVLVALYVGRLDPQKGLPVLLEAAAKVARNPIRLAPDSGRRRGPTASPCTIGRDRSRPCPAGSTGSAVATTCPALLKAADLLVLPSLWEGMPNVVLEAMAAGRAVVASAVEGTEDLVIPGETGWLVPPGESDAAGRRPARSRRR